MLSETQPTVIRKLATIVCPLCKASFKLKYVLKRPTLTCPKCKVAFPFPDTAIVQIVDEPVMAIPNPTKKTFDWSWSEPLPELTRSMKVFLWIIILANAISLPFALKEISTAWLPLLPLLKIQVCIMVAIVVSAIGMLKRRLWGLIGLGSSFIIGMLIAPWFADNPTSGGRCFLYYGVVGRVFVHLGNAIWKQSGKVQQK